MPTYDYACRACGYEFEEFQSITADALKKCPKCKKNKLERLIGAGAGFIFKGGGFYETDYRSDKYKKDAKADQEAAKKSKETKTDGKKSEAKKETKSAPKKTENKSTQASSKSNPTPAKK